MCGRRLYRRRLTEYNRFATLQQKELEIYFMKMNHVITLILLSICLLLSASMAFGAQHVGDSQGFRDVCADRGCHNFLISPNTDAVIAAQTSDGGWMIYGDGTAAQEVGGQVVFDPETGEASLLAYERNEQQIGTSKAPLTIDRCKIGEMTALATGTWGGGAYMTVQDYTVTPTSGTGAGLGKLKASFNGSQYALLTSLSSTTGRYASAYDEIRTPGLNQHATEAEIRIGWNYFPGASQEWRLSRLSLETALAVNGANGRSMHALAHCTWKDYVGCTPHFLTEWTCDERYPDGGDGGGGGTPPGGGFLTGGKGLVLN